MNRDHLRVVSSTSAPSKVVQLETLSFAQVEGGLVILHNDKRITPSEALVALWTFARLLRPALLGNPTGKPEAELKLRRLLPGDMGGSELADEDDAGAEPSANLRKVEPGLDGAEQSFLRAGRHQRGYPINGPKPVCAETEGDMS